MRGLGYRPKLSDKLANAPCAAISAINRGRGGGGGVIGIASESARDDMHIYMMAIQTILQKARWTEVVRRALVVSLLLHICTSRCHFAAHHIPNRARCIPHTASPLAARALQPPKRVGAATKWGLWRSQARRARRTQAGKKSHADGMPCACGPCFSGPASWPLTMARVG
jgi:hypothetical protein